LLLLLALNGRRDVGQHLPDLRYELRDVDGAVAELRAQLLGRARRDVRAQGFDEWDVGETGLVLVAVSPQNLHAAQVRVHPGLFGETRLPDPRLAGDHHQTAVPGERAIHRSLQRGELFTAPDVRSPRG